jgi:hypothetical protein
MRLFLGGGQLAAQLVGFAACGRLVGNGDAGQLGYLAAGFPLGVQLAAFPFALSFDEDTASASRFSLLNRFFRPFSRHGAGREAEAVELAPARLWPRLW